MKRFLFILTIAFILTSCESSSNKSSRSLNSDYYTDTDSEDYEGFEDGTYSASVDYYNPKTGYSSTYTLDVEVESNQVTIIYFPNDGYLDDDHIWPGDIDEDGSVSIEGEEGKTYDIQIDL